MSSNLRQRYSEDAQRSFDSISSLQYSDSDSSDHSDSTAPTEHGFVQTTYPWHHGKVDEEESFRMKDLHRKTEPSYPLQSRASVDTYASTISSSEDLHVAIPEYQVPVYHPELYVTDALPATPRDFAELFPSTRKLMIAHDDSTPDGNMNLRIDTLVTSTTGRTRPITLFHLRMHDLKRREFSFRRYDRDSGREVCHSVRKYQKTSVEGRPGFQRSLSNALASLRNASSKTIPTLSALKRSDSGYESINAHSLDISDPRPKSAGCSSTIQAPIPTNTTKLEFSNYAQVEVKRRGNKSTKRYEFEYWGRKYMWKRASHKTGVGKQVSYHLYSEGGEHALAHIMPETMSPSQLVEEKAKGGWVPPCSMWVSDDGLCKAKNDVSDVVVASGIFALVDDCIKSRFQSKQPRHLLIPLPKFKIDMDNFGPKQHVKDAHSRPSTSYSTHEPPPIAFRRTSRG